MTTCEIVPGMPLAGTYDELLFGEDSGTFTRVKFSDQAATWLGVFQNGPYPASQHRAFAVGQKAVVLASGLLYAVDLGARTAVLLPSHDSIQAVIADENQIFAAAFVTITVFDYHGRRLKTIDGYYFDLFDFKTITPTQVHGQYYQQGGDWASLTINRQTLEIEG